MYEARANSGIDRMKIINSVAKCVPGPHKVDLSNPDKTIVVEIVKVKICSLPCCLVVCRDLLIQNHVLHYWGLESHLFSLLNYAFFIAKH